MCRLNGKIGRCEMGGGGVSINKSLFLTLKVLITICRAWKVEGIHYEETNVGFSVPWVTWHP